MIRLGPARPYENLLGFLGLVAIAAGLAVAPATLAFDLGGAAAGLVSQVAVTGPAVIVTVLASLLNLGAAAIVVRVARGRPYRSITELALWGFAGAVLLDLVVLCVLGGLLVSFHAPILILLNAGTFVLLISRRARPFVSVPVRPLWRPSLLWVLIAVVWSGPVLVALASPVVAFMDVLPNHVAPVEHLRVFGSFDPLTTNPSPGYGPSRLSLGYIGLLGTVTVMSGLPAALSVSAFVVVEVVLVALSVRCLASSVGGPQAALWVLVAFGLTQAFARLQDDRARILALAVATFALVEYVRASRHTAIDPADWSRTILAAGALGATVLLHPVIGAFAAGTVLLATALIPLRTTTVAVPVLAVAAAIALPQGLIMLGVPMAPEVALTVIPVAIAAALVGRVEWVRRVAIVLARMFWVGLGVAIALLAAAMPTGLRAAVDVLPAGVLLVVASVGCFWSRRRLVRCVLAGAVTIGLVAALMAAYVPGGASLLADSIRYEVPKTVTTWLGPFLATYGAVAIAVLLRRLAIANGRLRLRAGAVAAVGIFVVIAALPLRSVSIVPLHVGEHRLSEGLAIALRTTERGFWEGYRDSRTLVDGNEQRLLGELRRRIAIGDARADTEVLHVAKQYQAWASTPIAPFTGLRETTISENAGQTIHNVGASLYPVTDLGGLLAESPGRFQYVVLEARGLPSDVRDTIIAQGFELTYTTDRAELFECGSDLCE